MIRTTRRAFLIGAATAVAFSPKLSLSQARPRIVIIGGGFGGATCARALRRADPQFEVTLVEPNPTFTACPFSNAVIAGLRDMTAQRFGYDAIRAAGIAVAQDQATAVDPQARRVTLRDGSVDRDGCVVVRPDVLELGAEGASGFLSEAAVHREQVVAPVMVAREHLCLHRPCAARRGNR